MHSPLQKFDKTIQSLVHLQELIQYPWSQYTDGEWCHLYLEEFSDEDEDVEELQLCLILRFLGLSRIRSLGHMKFTVQGPAFWIANHLGWFLSNGDHRCPRAIRAH